MYKMLSWVAVIFWMLLIFYFSHQPASSSNQLSTGITEVIVEKIELVAPSLDFNRSHFNHIVRKNAHFLFYLLLGVLVFNAMNQRRILGFQQMGIAWFICVLYAVSDEIHQQFISGRGPQLTDVLIDSTGASVGIFLYYTMKKFIKSKR